MAEYSIGVDLHKESAYWTVLDSKRNRVWQGQTPATRTATEDTLRSLPGTVDEYCIAFEPVTHWSWFADLLEELEVSFELVNSLGVGLIAKSRLKNDKVDSEILAELLRSGFLPTSYVAPKEVRELREIIRWRRKLVQIRTMLKNRIHSILHKNGINYPGSDLFGKKGRAWLEKETKEVPQATQVESLLRIFDSTEEELVGLRNLIRRTNNRLEKVKLLKTIPGIGDVVALTVYAEVGDFARFGTPEKVASFAGLVPSSYSSGEHIRHGHITRQGSPMLRWALVQAAQRVNPSWGQLWRFYQRVSHRKGKKRARVALARKLITIAWHIVLNGQVFKVQHINTSGGVKR